jgi:hypothetical protein
VLGQNSKESSLEAHELEKTAEEFLGLECHTHVSGLFTVKRLSLFSILDGFLSPVLTLMFEYDINKGT